MLDFLFITPSGLVGRYQCLGVLNMEAVCSFETLVTLYNFTLRYNPEDQHPHLDRRENLRMSY